MSEGFPVRVSFRTEIDLAKWYARALTEGSILVPLPPFPIEVADVPLSLELSDGRAFAAYGRVLEERPNDQPPMLRVLVFAGPELRDFLERYALRSREGRLQTAEGGRRKHARYDTMLNVRIMSYRQLSEQYVVNISQAGLFVRTTEPPPVGSTALLTVKLPNHESYEIEARVVHVVTREEAERTGQVPGIGVTFLKTQPAFNAAVAKLLETYRQRSPRVLLVDDDPLILAIVGDLLRTEGMTVQSAPDGYRAMRALAEGFFELDLMVLDLVVPGVDGLGILERVRRLGRAADLRIVVLSGADAQSLAQARAAGADEVLAKGCEADDLVRAVWKALERRDG